MNDFPQVLRRVARTRMSHAPTAHAVNKIHAAKASVGMRRHARANGSYAVLLDDGECSNLGADKARELVLIKG
jgi:hypothetical protein